MTVTYHLISPQELDASLTLAWREIQQLTPIFSSPFFSPEFTKLVGTVRHDVRVVVVEQNGKPVGFFPYQRSFGGWGRPVGGALSDYHGVITLPECCWNIKDLLRAAKLDVWQFDHLVDASGKFDGNKIRASSSPQIDLRDSYERYALAIRESGSDYIVKTERLARKLEREEGEVHFDFQDCSEEAFEKIKLWKSKQCARTGSPDVFGVKWTGELLAKVLNEDTENFGGVCSVLKVKGRIVAGHIGMRSKTVFHYWFPSYDTSVYSKFSTGIILLLRMAKKAAELGIEKIDLGKGSAQYKTRLMTNEERLFEGITHSSSLLGYIARVREGLDADGTGMANITRRIPLRIIRKFESFRRFS